MMARSESPLSGSRTIAPEENCPPDNCPQGKLLPEQLPLRKIAPQKIAPLTIKFSPKIIAPLYKFPSKSNTSELRKAMHYLRVL